MNDLALARALHVAAVVVWIGGVSVVTTVLLPMMRKLEPSRRPAFFAEVERRFRPQARLSVLVAGLSGLYMVIGLDLWDRFASAVYWWMHAMVLLWCIFAALLFVIEPLLLHRRLASPGASHSDASFRFAARLHWAMLVLSLVTILGAVAGSHGFWFG